MPPAEPSSPDAGAPRRALVVEGGATHVLAAARCLARAGWEVGVATAGQRPRTSGAVRRCHQVPAAEGAPDAWVDTVAGLVARHGYDVVFGADDIEVLLLSARRADIGCVVPYGAHADVVRAIDKLELVRAAEGVGLGVPRTQEATASALAAVDGPVVVKARLHWDPADAREARHLLAEVCTSAADAARAAAAMADGGGVPLLQEALDGELSALSLVRDRGGRVLGVVQQRSPRLSRRRTSCRAVTVPVDADLLAGVERLLAELGWWGLANLQFLTVPGDRPRLIDLNGRFYGSLALAVASGVPLPDLWGRTALGEVVEPAPAARVGVRFQSFFEDLARARSERRGGLFRDVVSTVAHGPGAAHPHADLRDPGPGLRLLRDKVVRRG